MSVCVYGLVREGERERESEREREGRILYRDPKLLICADKVMFRFIESTSYLSNVIHHIIVCMYV